MKKFEEFKINESSTLKYSVVGRFMTNNVKKWFFSENDNFAELNYWNKNPDYAFEFKLKNFDKDIISRVEKMRDFFNLKRDWKIVAITSSRVGFYFHIKSDDMPIILERLKEIDPENIKTIDSLLKGLEQRKILNTANKYNL